MPGQFARYWNTLHKGALAPDQPAARPDPITDPALTRTTILPAVKSTGQQARDDLPFFEFQSWENPLVMLFGAVVAATAHFKHIPAALFINSALVPALRRETEALTGRPYDGHFRFYHPGAMDGKIKVLPVFTETNLPDLLKIVYNGQIGRDRVIAISEV